MKFIEKKCPICRVGKMRVQTGRRGKYYWCPVCRHTINQRPRLLPIKNIA